MNKISRLKNISPRDAWKHEAHDFTPWLFDNLQELGNAIGLELEPEGTEVSVGSFSADILARDAQGRLVLIENQLESTDHTHLGQLLTYLSGLDAEIVVWVATDFRDPHLSAINWLNEHTDERFAFFAIKLRVVAIDNSPVAPIFEVLARPNEWNREMHRSLRASTGERSSVAPIRREFWNYYLQQYPEAAELGVQVTGLPSIWLPTPRGIGLYVSIFRSKRGVGVSLRGPRGTPPSEIKKRIDPHFDRFLELVGECNPATETDHPYVDFHVDMDDRENWGKAIDFMHERGKVFLFAVSEVFKEDIDGEMIDTAA